MNWKVPGWAAAAGAVISLVAALAGGNPFGTILLRAVVSALVAGALGLGARYVLRRFLPGIEAPPAPPQTVDILLDEELPLAPQAGGRQEEEELGAEPLESLAEEAAPDGGPDFTLGEEEGDSGLEGLRPTAPEPFPELPEAESLQAPAQGGLAGPEQSGQRSAPAVEELPPGESLEALSAADSDVLSGSYEAGLPSRRALKAEELEAQLDSVTKGQDPASLAKAVRTFLRKDQEG